MNRNGGATVVLGAGRTYLLDRHIHPGSGAEDLIFSDCGGLTIEGNGSRIAVKGHFHRDQASVRSLSGLVFRNCHHLTLRNLELDGGVGQTTRVSGLSEPSSHGLAFHGCSSVTIERVTVHHFAADGLYIRDGRQGGVRRASRGFAVHNSRFLFNGRQALSIIQLRGGLFENCDFSHTGHIDADGRIGPYGSHSPGAGIDIEPNRTAGGANSVDVMTGDLLIRGCRLVGNAGAALVAAKALNGVRFIERVTIDSCHLECNAGTANGRDGFIFDVDAGVVRGCTLRMRDKTAYLGWYPGSSASPRFLNNKVYGRNPGRNHPIFTVRPTRGSPVVEGNRFAGQQTSPKDPRGAWILFIDNPKATIRANSVFVPAAAFPGNAGLASVPVVFANAGLMEGNRYETDLASGSASFAVVYAAATRTHDEAYLGHPNGPGGSFRPVR